MTRERSTARSIGRIVAVCLGVVLLLSLGAFAFLFTPPGERWLKGLLVSQANQRLRGKLSIEALDYRGDALHLENVALEDRQGKPVASASELMVDLALFDLIQGKAHLDQLTVSDYRVRIRQDQHGDWNIAELVAPSDQKQPPPAQESEWAIDSFELTKGKVSVRSATTHADREFVVESLASRGSLIYQGGLLRGELDMHGRATRPLQAPLDVDAQARVEGGTQLARLDASLGANSLEAKLRLPGAGSEEAPSLKTLQAELDVDVPDFDSGGFSYGPLRVSATWDSGRLRIQSAHVELPGLVLEQRKASEHLFAATAHIENLTSTARSLEALLGRQIPEISGDGQLAFHLERPLDSPVLSLEGQLDTLGLKQYQAHDVQVRATVRDLTRPREGSFILEVGALHAFGRNLRGLQLEVSNQDRRLQVETALREPRPIQLAASGVFSKGYDALRLNQLRLSYPDATWSTENRRARLGWKHGGIVLQDLELRSREQRIGLDLTWTNNTQQANVTLQDLKLSSLPEVAMPENAPSRGVVSGEVTFQGPPRSPTASADLELAQLSIAGMTARSAELDARYRSGQLQGSLKARTLGGTLQARFDVPVPEDLSAMPAASIAADVQVFKLDVAKAYRSFKARLPESLTGRIENIDGELTVRGQLGGTWKRPRVKARVELANGSLEVRGVDRYQDVRLVATLRDDQLKLSELHAETKTGSLDARGEARRVGDALMEFRYHLQLSATQLPIPLEDPVMASFIADMKGIASAEQVSSEVILEDLTLWRDQAYTPQRSLPEAPRPQASRN